MIWTPEMIVTWLEAALVASTIERKMRELGWRSY